MQISSVVKGDRFESVAVLDVLQIIPFLKLIYLLVVILSHIL